MESPRGTKEDRMSEERKGRGVERADEVGSVLQSTASLNSTVGCKCQGAAWAPKVFWQGGHMGKRRSQMGRAGDRTGRSEGEAAGT